MGDSAGEGESSVVFEVPGEGVRAMNGIVDGYDGDFLILRRRNETIRINKRYIVKIESRGVH